MSITMSQLASRYAAAANKVQPSARRNLDRLAQVGVGLVKVKIQAVHAVDFGTMLNSTTAEPDGEDAYLIGPTVDYAAYVALGTRYVAARPFHTMAATELHAQARAIGFDTEDVGI